MSTSNPYKYIHTGLIIRLLRHASDFDVESVIGEIKKLGNNLKSLGFLVSHEGIHDLVEVGKTLEEEDQNRRVTKAEVKQLSSILSVIEKMVFAEAKTKEIYILPDTRFNINHLMKNPENLFATGIFFKLPELASYDVSEGFQCIVHSRPTACAFHMLRGTEAVIKKYYLKKIKRKREKKPMWGNMIAHLQTKRNKDDKLLQRLDYIRIHYRNPTAHPEETYTFDTAQDLLGLCIDVINAMGKEI